MKEIINLNIAKKLRDNEGYTIAATKDKEVIYKSKSKGILPLYLAYENNIKLDDASVADKVVGKGAAMLMVKLNIKELDTIIISKPALRYLQDNNVVVSYARLSDYIANRNKDGKCPVETMAETSLDFDAFISGVKQFLKRLELI